MKMDDPSNLNRIEGIKKIKALVEEIKTCLMCTNLKNDDGATCRPMSAQEVDDEGNLWFFSAIDSDKNLEIKDDRHVQLFFAQPNKNSYLVVNGEAKIIIDSEKTNELWSPLVKQWFQKGKNDPNISIIKVLTKSAYYWNAEGNSMINFFKMAASAVTGENLVNGEQGKIVMNR